jgi:putative membrane protein
MAAAIVAISTIGYAIAFTLAWRPSSAIRGVMFGLLGLAVPLLASDILASTLFIDDELLTPRRFTILSYTVCIVNMATVILLSCVASLTGRSDLLSRGIMFAITVGASLRYISITVFSTRDFARNLTATFIQPVLWFGVDAVLLPIPSRIQLLGIVGLISTIVGVRLLLWVMDRWEGGPRGLKLIPLFRAFILAWSEELNDALEDQITQFGEVRDLEMDSLVFRDVDGGCRAVLVVPYIHPGPFRNVGSSGLPKVISDKLGKKLGCEAIVPHGVSTHSRDLTRSEDLDRAAETLASKIDLESSAESATSVIVVEKEGAQASCQIFDGVALLSLTVSPKSCDDLPEELAEKIMKAAGMMGVSVIVVDSHNSLGHVDELSDSDVDNLYSVALEALEMARRSPRYSLSVGTARIIPGEWGLDEGIGPCGISVFTVFLENGNSSVYAVVDGNNMQSGLREKIVSALRSRGFDFAEVWTSDTHLVNAIGATTRGYYTIGERTEESSLIRYIVNAAEVARIGLTKCRVSYSRVVVPQLTVLGNAGLNLLGDVLESAFSLLKRTAATILPVSLALSAATIFLL